MPKLRKRGDGGQTNVAAGVAGTALVLVVLVMFVMVIMFVRGWKSVPPDKLMVHYTGGPLQGTHFVEVVPPGTHTKFYGLLDNYYELPATQRTYTFSRDPNGGDKAGIDFVAAPSAQSAEGVNDNVMFTFEATVYFKLNTKPDVVKDFMNQICFHDNCFEGDGWRAMLEQYFRPQVEQAVRIEVGKYDRFHLYSDPATLLAINHDIGSVLKDRINTTIGGEFFCGPDATADTCTDFGFTIKNPQPPQEVVDEYSHTAASQQRVTTANNEAAAKVAAAKGDADAQAVRASAPALTPEQIDYIRAQAMQKCAENGNCTLIITDGGAGVNVNTSPR